MHPTQFKIRKLLQRKLSQVVLILIMSSMFLLMKIWYEYSIKLHLSNWLNVGSFVTHITFVSLCNIAVQRYRSEHISEYLSEDFLIHRVLIVLKFLDAFNCSFIFCTCKIFKKGSFGHNVLEIFLIFLLLLRCNFFSDSSFIHQNARVSITVHF